MIRKKQINWQRRKKRKKFVQQVISHTVLLAASILFIFPFFWMISTSLKSDAQQFVFPLVWIPHPVMWGTYLKAVNFIPFFTYLKNTFYLCTMNVIGVVISSSLVAYGFSRIRWYGRNVLFIVFLSTLMIPYQATMIPLFIIFRKIGWVGTFKPLWVPAFFGSLFFIFLLRQFFRSIPMELSDSAKIDGASEFCIYAKIILPLSKPALAVAALFTFMWTWIDFLRPLIYLNDQATYTLSLGLQQFQTHHGTEWGMLMAISVLITIPILILFFFTQKTFIQGITLTGIKR